MTKLRRAISVDEIMSKKFKDIQFDGQWKSLLGIPELSGVWIIWGQSFNGKTSFCLQLAKELTKYASVLYNSLEEGARKSMKESLERNHMYEVKRRFHIVQEPIETLKLRLRKRRSADVVFIDSLQYSDLTKADYKKLKEEFPNKLFIMVSHAEGKQPKGRFADFVRYDCDIKIFVEGYKATCMSRLASAGNTSEYIIWQKGADDYWGTNFT